VEALWAGCGAETQLKSNLVHCTSPGGNNFNYISLSISIFKQKIRLGVWKPRPLLVYATEHYKVGYVQLYKLTQSKHRTTWRTNCSTTGVAMGALGARAPSRSLLSESKWCQECAQPSPSPFPCWGGDTPHTHSSSPSPSLQLDPGYATMPPCLVTSSTPFLCDIFLLS